MGIDIGSVVYNYHHGLLRFGTVREKFVENKWTHFRVDWVQDQVYNEGVEWTNHLRNEDTRKYTFRADEIRPVELDHLKAVVRDLDDTTECVLSEQ